MKIWKLTLYSVTEEASYDVKSLFHGYFKNYTYGAVRMIKEYKEHKKPRYVEKDQIEPQCTF